MNEVEFFPILRLTGESSGRMEETVARDSPVTIILNDQELVTMLYSPTDLRYLTVGFLTSEGLLESRDGIKNIGR